MIERIDRVFHQNGMTCSVPVPGLVAHLKARPRQELPWASPPATARCGARRAGALGLDDLRRMCSVTLVPRPKPAPDIVHAFSSAVGVPPHEIVVIGDNPHDLDMARKRAPARLSAS